MSAASAQGWYARATAHPFPDFTLTKDAFVFAVLLNAPVDPEGFTMALFQPDVAIDAQGRVLQPQPQDFAALAALAQEASRLPDTGSFMNAWRVSHPRTSQKIDRLFAKTSDSGDIRETSVQGWDPEKTQLQNAVGDHQALPPVLQELFGYIQEARTGFVRGEENKELISQVKALVDN
ncbi:hypothetical protein GSI_13880 [Ganoderma sinense ZZ0214-1]|uniref:Uncharacterized protein n=1 Tax=Ganoderma sinense ZZ0214-1 TaxID=1077348 RepID=A0A2G8RS17_9APHY|nr:hypothetical protein GSI_13880 [Ganoderma sinense ZZ0214-1]